MVVSFSDDVVMYVFLVHPSQLHGHLKKTIRD